MNDGSEGGVVWRRYKLPEPVERIQSVGERLRAQGYSDCWVELDEDTGVGNNASVVNVGVRLSYVIVSDVNIRIPSWSCFSASVLTHVYLKANHVPLLIDVASPPMAIRGEMVECDPRSRLLERQQMGVVSDSSLGRSRARK